MSLRPFRNIDRKNTKVINVGNVKVGGDNPISVQSMTNTLTTDVSATIKQIQEIHEEGADIVRVSCPDEDSSKALKEITKNVQIPVIADIHFHYKRAIEAAENGANCLRINPGNIDKNTSEDLTLTLKLKKSSSSKILIFLNALSTKASGHGSLYFSRISFSREPALTPILIEQLLFFAADITSLIFFLSPILPGFILKHFAPFSADSIALL